MRCRYAIITTRSSLVAGCYDCPCVCPSIRSISEQLEIPYNISVALKLCYHCNPGSPKPRVSLFGGNHVMLRIQLLFGTTALFVGIELLYRSILWLPSKEQTEWLYSKVSLFDSTNHLKNEPSCRRPGILSLNSPIVTLTSERERESL